jgi:hypothetical protein
LPVVAVPFILIRDFSSHLFSFSPDDQNKIMNKDIKLTKHFEGKDKSQPSCSNSDNSSIDSFVSYDDASLVILKNGQTSLKKPSFQDYMNRFGKEHAKTWFLKYTIPGGNLLKKKKMAPFNLFTRRK